MSDMSVSGISHIRPINIYDIDKILSSSSLTDYDKLRFLRRNAGQINDLLKVSLNSAEYNALISQRPLLSYKPIRNAFTKRGDKILLAKAIGVPENKIEQEIAYAMKSINDFDSLNFLTKDQIKSLKTYIYRHGTKEQMLKMLNYELGTSPNVISIIKKTLEYNNFGVADYFTRPIHRMSNKTFVNIFS